MPYEKLLELVESKQLDITTISLAEVTADFIKHIESLENQIDPGFLSDFVTIAAKLLLIKSKALLPEMSLTENEEADIKDLQSRLVLYKEFRAVSKRIKKLWRNNAVAFSRPLLLNNQSFFYPPKNLSPIDLLTALANLAIEIQQLLPEQKEITTTLVSLEEKMEELISRLNQTPQQQLQQLVADRSRKEIVVIFLAILHLLKNQLIKVDQNQWINLT